MSHIEPSEDIKKQNDINPYENPGVIQNEDNNPINDNPINDNLTSKEPEYTPEEIDDLFKEDDYDDLENTSSNNDWLNNKKIIDSTYRTTGISTGLSNYGKNLILFYEKKIKSVNELMKRKFQYLTRKNLDSSWQDIFYMANNPNAPEQSQVIIEFQSLSVPGDWGR